MIERIEACVEKLEQCGDPVARETARQLVQALLALHKTALTRVLLLAAENEGGPLLPKLTADKTVSQLLILHELHPDTLESRVAAGLEKARPALQAHGGNVELVEVRDGRVRLKLLGNCQGCPSSAQTMKSAVESAILESAPDVHAIEVL